MADERGRELLAQLAHFTEAQAAAATALARKSVEQTVAAAALATAFARRRARSAGKFTQADEMFFTRAGYEQSTSEAVARHRAERFARYRTVVDLCCGIGSDTIALAGAPRRSRDVIGVDNDTDALACATLNARAYGVEGAARFVLSDALRYPLACEAAFADPSRRDARGRVARSSSYQPPLEAVLQRAREIKGHALAVKIAPGLRVGPDSLRSWCEAPVELEYVSERGECKEAVIWCGDFARGHGARRASVTDADGCHELDGPADRAAVGALRRWLAEPDPAVIRAGLIGELCRRTGATLVDSDVAYMTADSPIASPFARWFEVVDSMPFGVKRVRATLRSKDFGKLTIKTRAFPLAPDEIAALLKTHGEKAALLVCTTFGGVKTAVICKPPAART